MAEVIDQSAFFLRPAKNADGGPSIEAEAR